MKRNEERQEWSSRCARLDRMRMCVQPVAGGRQPTNRGKIMGRTSFVYVGGSMLSAFTFREFRVINRRAGRRFTRVRMRACVYLCMCLGSTAPEVAASSLRWGKTEKVGGDTRIFGIRAIYAPRFLAPLPAPSCRVAKRCTKATIISIRKGHRRPRPLFLITNNAAIRTSRIYTEPSLVCTPHSTLVHVHLFPRFDFAISKPFTLEITG